MSGKAPAKAPAGGQNNADFRARRLSVAGVEEALPVAPAKKGGTPTAGGRRARRMSMSPEMGVIKPKALLPFTVESVGTYSCHGVEPGIRQGETSAKINQDRGCVCFPFGSDSATKTMTLMCVFDGHGAQGDKVSHYVMNEVQKKLEDHPTLESNPEKAMKDVFVDVDNALRKDPTIDAELSGTTAVVCLFVLEATGLVIYTANAGDSRATIGQNRVAGQPMKSHNLSEDQKPDSPQEMKRIQKAGGHVSPPEEEWGGPARVWIDASMTLPGLAMARSIGDHLVKTVGVIPDPEVTKYAVKPGDEFLVMASDGVWEFIDSPEGVNLVAQFIEASATEACTRLIETSAAKWRQEEGDYRDDITAICVRLADVAKDMAQA